MEGDDPGPPTSDRRLRRSIIREAVADNVRAPGEARSREGRAAPARAKRPASARRWLVAALLALVAIAAGGLMRSRHPATADSATTRATSGASPEAAGDLEPPTPRFEAPVGINTSVFPLAVERVTVDAGHGGEDYGTSAGSLAEKDLTLDIAKRLAKHLERGGYDVILTRTDDRALSLRERVQLANEERSDLFVSIHVNWFGSASVRGVETYYLGATEDPELMALAQRENRQSGYSLADLRDLLDGVYADLRQEESRRLAGRVQRALYRSLLPISPELSDRGVKSAPFVVLVATEMPAVLAEVSCLSNHQEAERLERPRYREHIAEALFRGIEAYARDVTQMVEKGS